MIPTEEGACNLAWVLEAEAAEIRQQCDDREREDRQRDPPGANPETRIEWDLKLDGIAGKPVPDRFGLAFSGGGIRSACVALGVVQRLAQSRMLSQVHYISGISGGGYLLGWLSAWIRREGSLLKVEDQLGQSAVCGPITPAPTTNSTASASGYHRFVEPEALHFLRRYSSYLTPRVGLVSGDTLAMISVYLRNLLLNQTMLAMAAVSSMLLLQLLAPPLFWSAPICDCLVYPLLAVFIAIFSSGVIAAAESLRRLGSNQVPREWLYAARIAIACGILACVLIWWLTPSWYARFPSAAATTITVVCVMLVGFALSAWRFSQKDALTPVDLGSTPFGLLLIAWLTVGGLCLLLDHAFRKWLIDPGGNAVHVGDSYTIFALPCLLIALTFVSYAFIGILGGRFPDPKREWLARLAGYFLLFAVLIAGLLVVALRGPMLMHLLFTSWRVPSWKKYLLSAVVPGGWLFVVVAGLLGAKSAKSSGAPSQPTRLDPIIAIAPPVFLVGVLLLVSWGTHKLVRWKGHTSPDYLTTADWSTARETPGCPLCTTNTATRVVVQGAQGAAFPRNAGPGLGLARFFTHPAWGRLRASYLLVWLFSAFGAFLLAVRLDVNEFSLHLFYRNRLVRAFLGASNSRPTPRLPSPFTGFALDDDIALQDLSSHPTPLYKTPFPGPYPLWGATLNMTAGEDLAWQQRKGASFLYSPLFCGWDYVHEPSSAPESRHLDPDTVAQSRKPEAMNLHGYRSNIPGPGMEGYGGCGGRAFIGTAMAASGAAVSPNMGYHTRPGVAALLALFNLRLGWWSGNPRSPSYWKRYAPAIWYLVAELLGKTGDKSKYVYLSDGGHFENLGVYELVRRKTRFIICSDADADPQFSFKDLGNAIDRCRRDFGVEIHIRAQRDVGAEGGKQFRGGHYAIGEICYPGQTGRGCLLYIKSSLTNDEPSDVLGMKAADSDFPHDSTANQFFNEAMFESYRALGEHMMDVILESNGITDRKASPCNNVAKLFTNLMIKAAAQKKADKTPKTAPLAVSVAGGVSVHMDG